MAELKIKADSGGGTVSLKGPSTTTSNAAVQLTLPVDDGTTGQYLKTDGSGALSWATVAVGGATGTDYNDGVKTRWGTGNDLEIYHTGGDYSYIKDNSGRAYIRSNRVYMQNAAGDENLLYAEADDGTYLYFNGSTKLSTTNIGVSVTGSLTPSSGLYLGGSGGSNWLNDYEKGTWTAVLQHNNGTAVTYSSAPNTTECHYTKIGRMVLAHGYINNFDISGSGTGNPSISLPFQVATGASHCPGTLVHYTCFAHGNVRCLAEPSSSRLDFFQDNSVSRTTWNGNANTYLMFAVTYSSNT